MEKMWRHAHTGSILHRPTQRKMLTGTYMQSEQPGMPATNKLLACRLEGLTLRYVLQATRHTRQHGHRLDFSGILAARLPTQRISVWLPPGYTAGQRAYPVLYMHDGQNLFDPSVSAFNKVWAADQAMLQCARAGLIAPHIIVGVWSPGHDRSRQYLPNWLAQQAPDTLRQHIKARAQRAILGDAYIAWLSGPLKACVDRSFRTRPGPRHTAMVGSSMGGLISCHALAELPQVYGRVAALSPHWPVMLPPLEGETQDALIALWDAWLQSKLGAPAARRLWIDRGTDHLEAAYAPYHARATERLQALGWALGTHLESRIYPATGHNEDHWRARLPEVLAWLLR